MSGCNLQIHCLIIKKRWVFFWVFFKSHPLLKSFQWAYVMSEQFFPSYLLLFGVCVCLRFILVTNSHIKECISHPPWTTYSQVEPDRSRHNTKWHNTVKHSTSCHQGEKVEKPDHLCSGSQLTWLPEHTWQHTAALDPNPRPERTASLTFEDVIQP